MYKNSDPEPLLESLATREIVHFLAGIDLNDLLSQGRLLAAQTLRERIQNSANARALGAKIIFVGLQDIHPPTASDVASTYEKVVGAEQTKLARRFTARKPMRSAPTPWPRRRRSQPRTWPMRTGCNW